MQSLSSVSLASCLIVTLSNIHRFMSKSFPYFKEYSISMAPESFLSSENESRLWLCDVLDCEMSAWLCCSCLRLGQASPRTAWVGVGGWGKKYDRLMQSCLAGWGNQGIFPLLHSTPNLSSHSTRKTTVLLGFMHAEAQFPQKELFQAFSMSSPCSIVCVLPHLWPHKLWVVVV